MRMFGDFQFDPAGYLDAGHGQYFRNTPAYMEFVRRGYGEPAFYFTSYSLRLTPVDFFVMTCWGDFFDDILLPPLGSTRGYLAAFARELTTTKPILASLLANTVQEHPRGSVGVITRIVDPDNRDFVWVLGRVLGNYVPYEPKDPRMMRMNDDIANLSRAVYLEWYQGSGSSDVQPKRASGAERTVKVIEELGPRLLEVAFGELLGAILED